MYEAQKRWRKNNLEKSRKIVRDWNKRNKEKKRQSRREQYFREKDNPAIKFSIYKRRAKLRGRTFQITFEFFESIILQDCHYCKVSGKSGVDRKNDKIGYTEKNCVPCCWNCNHLKNSMDYKKFVEKRFAKNQ